MILHATLAHSTRITVPPSRAAAYRQVTFSEAIDVPEPSEAQAPVAIEYDERGEWTALRVHEGRLYAKRRWLGPAASMATMALDGTLFGSDLQAGAVPEDTVGLRGASAEMRQAAADEARRRLVLVDGQPSGT